MKKNTHRFLALPILVTIMILSQVFISTPSVAADQKKIMVFAAASTTNAVSETANLFMEKQSEKIITSFASSSTLAKQIAQGAPANVYISANPKWMKYLEDKEMIVQDTNSNILGNRIVMIVPVNSPVKTIDIVPGLNLKPFLGTGRISMGDPDHVPAGIYGKQAFESLGIWKDISTNVVRAKDVRTALTFVEREETPLGVVYSTDAAISKKVRVVGIFPENTHPPITYKAAVVKGNATEGAHAFMNFLKSPEAGAIFEKYGFSVHQ